ncbi:YcfL family protein [Testudinibacter sp. TR-2022]|uniref:YcfL family protein n=1 Tax=Testudinibacter sp. TR-2022 TaxID=2585029 RepID=UPI00111B9731|nr:YcfL family protein [Testudinibacter sp. TR-2022]TNH05865.1 DUF1425 domain-containing protein [Pasteurellaceae bacterium Phil11]TNH21913.1 DUF1425 domain-containing protein [Testudinibacter sp. TR-2022]TNH24534.1 DUF1425 domain-containing protein [Testudinibacter sp. TR-2022]
MKRFLSLLVCSMLLVACSSAPPRYLADSQPIVNIDSAVAAATNINAGSQQVTLTNLSRQLLALQYQITWYDQDGVTQLSNWAQLPPWTKIVLQGGQAERIPLQKPTQTSTNYRIYIKGAE